MPELTIPQAFDLALRHHQAGQFQQAERLYRQILARQPKHADALRFLGLLAQQAGHNDSAVDLLRQAITLKPDSAEAHYNLGNALRVMGQLDAAIAAYRQAMTLKPDYLEAHSNLGNLLRERGQPDAAIAAFRQALALNPRIPEIHCNLGLALQDNGQFDAALAAFRQAITLRPSYSEAHYNIGNMLEDLRQFDEAIAAFRQAIALKPNYPKAYHNLGEALKAVGRLDEALAAYRQALALQPDYADAYSNLLLALHYHPSSTAKSLSQEARCWAQRYAEPLRQFIQPHANDRSPVRRLRIGYLSADFREHASAFFIVPLLTGHDHQNFEIFCYAHVTHPDDLTTRIQSLSDHWHSTVGLADEAVVEVIHRDQIDILVDLKLHTASNRLLVFARKPAPVLATWLGYPGGTGLSTIDYRLSDSYLDPPGLDESVYAERTIRLTDSFWCYDPLDANPPVVGSLPALANGYVTFGCLNNFCKVNETVLRLWAKVLHAVPTSRLLLLAPMGTARSKVQKVLEREGIAPQRLEFVPHQPRRQYLESYQRMDLGLDTFPYNGHTTSLDSIWMGVPVITLAGQTAVGRAGMSLLSNLGLPELVAHSEEEYVRIAATLANDLPRLTTLRITLRQQMAQSPLMDAPRFARNMEAAYRQMWRQWCAKVR